MENNTTAIVIRAHELTPQQRAAKVTYLLMEGRTLSSRDVADMFGMSLRGAIFLMDNVSGAIPIYREQEPGSRWRRFDP